MRKLMFPLLCAMMMLSAGPALAGTTPAQRAAAIAPFVDEQTVAVVYLDLAAVDPDALAGEVERAGVPKEMTAHFVGGLKTSLANLTGAGAREVYVVVSTAYLLYAPCLVVVPLGPEADADAVAANIKDVAPEAAVIKGALCAGQPGVLARFRALAPAARPELEAAFAAAGDAPLVVMILPTADNRRAIEETLPVLPKGLGGGPSSLLTRGLRWASVGAHLPPAAALDLVVQSSDAQAAQALGERVPDLRQALVEQAGSAPNGPALKALLAGLSPVAQGDRLVLHVGVDELRTAVQQVLAPAVQRARDEAAATASLSQMHQILLAAAMYREDHKDWPDNLQQLGKYLRSPKLLQNPNRPDLELGYEYRKPANDAPPQTAVLWEKHDQWPEGGVNVGYADGAVELVRDRARFEQMLEKGR